MKGFTIIPDEFLAIDLTMTETICLSVIWGFSQDKDTWYYGSQSYLAERCRCSRRHIIRALDRLLELNLILKDGSQGKRCKYAANHDYLDVILPTCDNSSHGVCENVTGTCDKRSQELVTKYHIDNIDNNLVNNIDNRENIKREQSSPFSKPTIQDIEDYCSSQSIRIDCQHFWDYYESNGWRVGSNKMKDWKAAVRNWARRETGTAKNAKTESVLEHNLRVAEELRQRHYDNGNN